MANLSDKIAAPSAQRLSAEALDLNVDSQQLAFVTTDDVQLTADWYGQERALAALELGLRVRHPGYNIYVCGLTGIHREKMVVDLLQRFRDGQPAPGDRVLVQNFRNPDRPRALLLPRGWGRRLQADMQDLLRDLRRLLPEAFRKETFEEEKERISEKFGEQGDAINHQLADKAEAAGFALQLGPAGQIAFTPIREDRPMTEAEIGALTDEEREALRQKHRELQREVKSVLRQHQQLLRQLGREVKQIERRVASEAVAPSIDEVAEKYPSDEVKRYLEEVRQHVLEHLSDFQEQPPAAMMPPFMTMPTEDELFVDYQVNVLVDNSDNEGTPIIVEPAPTYRNLFGAVERMVDRHGRLVTNFTRVTAGSLLRAHGGCIVIPIVSALMEPFVWRWLKQCLKQQELEIEGYDPFSMFTTSALKPEAMHLDTRVVLVGPTEVFQMLYFYDDEFREIFKIRAEFGYEATGNEAQRNCIAEVARIAKTEGLLPFEAGAVRILLRQSARWVEHRDKVPSQWSELGDLMREAAFWAVKRTAATVAAADVERALDERAFRLNRTETKLRELIREGTLLLDIDGARVGQVNGLAVINLGGYEFGRPSRITASVSLGAAGVVAVDREAQMSGHTFDKAVLIITGYLRHMYAQNFPLALSASLAFEQSYSGIEGDSASAAEIFALISSLAGVPMRQDLAVTGSVNQFGAIQPIGGINEKVEGFFAVCKEVGLTGRQGVVLPIQNVDNLVLGREVHEAIRNGTFHLYPIASIDAGLEVFSGIAAGDTRTPGSVHYLAYRRLRRMARRLRAFGRGAEGEKPKAPSAPKPEPGPQEG